MVVYFCKVCNNLLMLEVDDRDCCTLKCATCPYTRPLEYHVRVAWTREKKMATPDEHFINMEEAKKLLPTSSTQDCPECGHDKAYYYEAQTRSADEPTTIFYRCCNTECNHSWKE